MRSVVAPPELGMCCNGRLRMRICGKGALLDYLSLAAGQDTATSVLVFAEHLEYNICGCTGRKSRSPNLSAASMALRQDR